MFVRRKTYNIVQDNFDTAVKNNSILREEVRKLREENAELKMKVDKLSHDLGEIQSELCPQQGLIYSLERYEKEYGEIRNIGRDHGYRWVIEGVLGV